MRIKDVVYVVSMSHTFKVLNEKCEILYEGSKTEIPKTLLKMKVNSIFTTNKTNQIGLSIKEN